MIIIDGHNLIGRSRIISLNDPQAKSKLLKLIENYQIVTNKKLIVVFDKINNDEFERYDYNNLEVRYPLGENTADDVIQNLIIKFYKKHSITIVTEDNDLIFFAKTHRVSHIKSRLFLNEIQRQSNPESKYQNELSNEETNKWLKIFNN